MKTDPITLQSIIKRAPDLLATNLDDETVLMCIENGAYYGMENTARRIWELLESPRNVADLVTQLAEEYQVSPDVCEPDILDYLRELYSEGLVIVA